MSNKKAGKRLLTGKSSVQRPANKIKMSMLQELHDQPSEQEWAPGVIHVVFKESAVARYLMAKPTSRIAAAYTSSLEELFSIFRKFNLLTLECTFPESKQRPKNKIEANRDRFVTLYFEPSKDITTDAVEALEALPCVERAAPMPRLAPPSSRLNEPLLGTGDLLTSTTLNCGSFAPGSPRLETQWYLFRCGVDKAWALTNPMLSGKGVVLADVDWGFRTDHEDLIGRIEIPFNTLNDNFMASDGGKRRHGTAVLGLAGAAINGCGIAGVAPEASLWAFQAGDDVTGVDVLTEFKSWVRAIDLIRTADSQNRRKVLMLEAQTLTERNVEMAIPINQAIQDAIIAGVVVCVAAGNSGDDANLGDNMRPIPPTGSILVGATEYDPDPKINRRARSNFGPRVTVYAPGDLHHDLTCSSMRLRYTNCFGGTSGATAKVGGVVALMLEANRALTHAEVEGILRTKGSLITDDKDPQGVFLDAQSAVSEALRLAT